MSKKPKGGNISRSKYSSVKHSRMAEQDALIHLFDNSNEMPLSSVLGFKNEATEVWQVFLVIIEAISQRFYMSYNHDSLITALKDGTRVKEREPSCVA